MVVKGRRETCCDKYMKKRERERESERKRGWERDICRRKYD